MSLCWHTSPWFCFLSSFQLRGWKVVEWLWWAPSIQQGQPTTLATEKWGSICISLRSPLPGSCILATVVTLSPLGNKWHISYVCSCGNSSKVYSSLFLFASRHLVMSEPVAQARLHEIHSLQRVSLSVDFETFCCIYSPLQEVEWLIVLKTKNEWIICCFRAMQSACTFLSHCFAPQSIMSNG